MKLKDLTPMAGGMCDYDYNLMQPASALLAFLQARPTFRWWNHFVNRPESILQISNKQRALFGLLHSDFMGWDSFVCRNPEHEMSREICLEFRRVYGRDATLLD